MTSEDEDKKAGVFITEVFIQLCSMGYMVSTWCAESHLQPGNEYKWVQAHEWFLKVVAERLLVDGQLPLRVGLVQSKALYESNSYVVISYYGGSRVMVHQQDKSEHGWTRAYLSVDSNDDTYGLANTIVRMTTELVKVVEDNQL